MLLAITGLRVKFAKLIPEPVKIGESLWELWEWEVLVRELKGSRLYR